MAGPPRLNLRRAASYNRQESGLAPPLSATTSRFNFNHLLFPPPPSPSLPALVPRPKRSSSFPILSSRPRRIHRLVLHLALLAAALYLFLAAFSSSSPKPLSVPIDDTSDEHYEMVGQDSLPTFATPIVVRHGRKSPKWTVSIPPDNDFPLPVQEYAEMGGRCREASTHARDLRPQNAVMHQLSGHRGTSDSYFVDVDEAERMGLLPGPSRRKTSAEHRPLVGEEAGMTDIPTCSTSLTYVLESSDAGLGGSLMLMWILYALAKEQGRAFFIDDSRWAYGAYTDIFRAPPLPRCRPAPRHHLLPCPVQARHLIVSCATAEDVLPELLTWHQRSSGAGEDQRGLFDLARAGYRALFILSPSDRDYVAKRVAEVREQAKTGKALAPSVPIIGLHIRRGDRHPLEYQYQDTYIPAEVFLRRSEQLSETLFNETGLDRSTLEPVTVIASDDPTVHEEADFAGSLPAQQQIRLASKSAIERANPEPTMLQSFKEEAQGWEGGFFAAMFWNLGSQRKNNAAATAGPGGHPKPLEPPSEQTLRLRTLLGRAYMMDLAVLAGASDKIVCAVSATGCRLLAVMLGWERAMGAGDWVNVDGSYRWRGPDMLGV